MKISSSFLIALVSSVLYAIIFSQLFEFYALNSLLGLALGGVFGAIPGLFQVAKGPSVMGAWTMSFLPLMGLTIVSGLQVYSIWNILLQEQPLNVGGQTSLLLLLMGLFAIYWLVEQLKPMEKEDWASTLGRLFSGPPLFLTLCVAGIFSSFCLVGLYYLESTHESYLFLTTRFLHRGIIPPLCLLLFSWGILLAFGKYWVLGRDARRCKLFFIGLKTSGSKIIDAYQSTPVSFPEKDRLDHFVDVVRQKSAEFYVVPRYINWSIPILGFIGTVLGISLAADGIQEVISSQSGISQLSDDLGKAISPLGIAFDTTLIALSLSICLVFVQALLQRWEEGVILGMENRFREQYVIGKK